MLGKVGKDARAYKIGFVLHPERDWLGASTDRLLNIGGQWALAEIKNWYETKRQKRLSDLPYLDKNLLLKRNHTYFYQVKTAMLVTGLKKCYFVVTESNQIEEVSYDENTGQLILKKSDEFYEDHLKYDRT